VVRIKAVIFDGGGTIWDNLGILYETYTGAYGETGLGKLPLDAAACHRIRGLASFNSEAGFATALVALKNTDISTIFACDNPDAEINRLIAEGRRSEPDFDSKVGLLQKLLLDYLYGRVDDGSYPLCPDVGRTLPLLRERGVRLCMVSNRRRASTVRILQANAIFDMFDMVAALEDQTRPKPSPEGTQKVLDWLGFRREECLFVGDSAVDIMSGRAAGLRCIGVLSGMADEQTLRNAGADNVIKSMAELLPEVFCE